jgi:monoamine oxidase
MITRRQLLSSAGALSGSAGVAGLLAALGAMPHSATAQTVTLRPARPQRKVLLLGAGISSLMAAFELEQAGYVCEILEASHRAGGRCMTLRSGDIVDEIGNRQVCRFDDDPTLYFNAGPSRIPHEHATVLGYCQRLGVSLETSVNLSPAAWLQFDAFNGGQRMRQKQYIADARGFMAELTQKGLDDAWLDAELGESDRDLLRQFLRSYGDLGAEDRYRGSTRSGYSSGGLVAPGVLRDTTALKDLLKADFWRMGMHFAESSLQSAVLQPVGGMDRIVTAVTARLRSKPRLHSVVVGIDVQPEGVEVHYRERGELRRTRADYCLSAIPAQLLLGVDNNFSADYRRLLAGRPRGKLSRLGLQMRERFWEAEGIYGGISWTGQDITQIMYPSGGFGGRKGVLVGAYILSGEINDRWVNLTAEERIERALQQGEKLHPGYRSYFESGVSVAWHRMNHMLGCTATGSDPGTAAALRAPFGRHYLIGDQVANYGGWLEASVLSALAALRDLDAREVEAA